MNYLLFLVGAYMALANTRSDLSKLDLNEWQSFKNEHGKSYGSSYEESLRKMIFAYNKQQVDDFNSKQSKELGFGLSLNHMADKSDIEMRAMNGVRMPKNQELLSKNSDYAEEFLKKILDDNTTSIPDEVDWRKTPGRVSEVKNQGDCGSCWAFAATGALEGQEYRKSNGSTFGAADLVELSEQNLVDCVTVDDGCDGGFITDALGFVSYQGGIDDENSYPYEARNGKCRFNKKNVVFTDKGYANLPRGDEENLKKVVARYGPVAVAIDASSSLFRMYSWGVFYNKDCQSYAEDLDHGVLVVGYGTDPKEGEYWIVKNSWGPDYGEHGYIRMARNRNNNCGIATLATIPTF